MRVRLNRTFQVNSKQCLCFFYCFFVRNDWRDVCVRVGQSSENIIQVWSVDNRLCRFNLSITVSETVTFLFTPVCKDLVICPVSHQPFSLLASLFRWALLFFLSTVAPLTVANIGIFFYPIWNPLGLTGSYMALIVSNKRNIVSCRLDH